MPRAGDGLEGAAAGGPEGEYGADEVAAVVAGAALAGAARGCGLPVGTLGCSVPGSAHLIMETTKE